MDFYNKETQERASHVWLAHKLGLRLAAGGPDDTFVAKALAAGFGQIKYSEPEFDPRTHAKEPRALKANTNGTFTQAYKVVELPAEVQAANLETAKGEKLAVANAMADEELRGLVAKYPEMEVSTFATQAKEAEAIMENARAEAPLLRSLAAARGIDLKDLAQRVLGHVSTFGQASGLVMGQRQAFEDRIEAAGTFGDLDAIDIAYYLPWKA